MLFKAVSSQNLVPTKFDKTGTDQQSDNPDVFGLETQIFCFMNCQIPLCKYDIFSFSNFLKKPYFFILQWPTKQVLALHQFYWKMVKPP